MELAFESSPVTLALTLFYKAVKAVERVDKFVELAFESSPVPLALTLFYKAVKAF